MAKKETLQLFENRKVRSLWDAEAEKWYISIVDVVGVLTESTDGRKYWNKLKQRLKEEGNESVTNCHQLKLQSSDGKYYKTDVADVEQLFRLVQSIPSPKAEPFKQWLAQLARERLEEIDDPEQGIITQTWSGFTTKQYKHFKDLKTESLRDNMTNLELVLNMLAEASTTEISKKETPQSFDDSKKIAHRGGKVAASARKELEAQTGEKVVSPLNVKKGTQKIILN